MAENTGSQTAQLGSGIFFSLQGPVFPSQCVYKIHTVLEVQPKCVNGLLVSTISRPSWVPRSAQDSVDSDSHRQKLLSVSVDHSALRTPGSLCEKTLKIFSDVRNPSGGKMAQDRRFLLTG